MLRILALVVAWASFCSMASRADHRFTVADSIAFSTFANVGDPINPAPSVSYSPDGRHFIAVTIRGNLATNRRIATIWLFDLRDVRAYLSQRSGVPFTRAKALAQLASASNWDPISYWRWSSDAQSILCIGADDNGVRRLYKVKLNGKIDTLSLPDQDVTRFDESNGQIVYLAHKAVLPNQIYQAAGPSLPDIEDGTGKSILQLAFPNWMQVSPVFLNDSGGDELWKFNQGVPVRVLSSNDRTPIRLQNARLALGPNGHSLLVTVLAKKIPKSWGQYQSVWDNAVAGVRMFSAATTSKQSTTNMFRPEQFALLDLDTGALHPLLDAPIDLPTLLNGSVAAAWSVDGARLALVGAYPPLNPADKFQQTKPCTIAVVDLKTHRFSCPQPQSTLDTPGIEPLNRKSLYSLAWQRGNEALLAIYGTRNAPNSRIVVRYTKNKDDTWSRALSTASDNLIVFVDEAFDRPPTLAVRAADSQAHILLDPNPQLKDIALGNATLYHWKDTSGDEWTGALVMPPNFSKARRYPLVIQTHLFNPSKFLLDGPSATAYAARALAARDILVLQVNEIHEYVGKLQESEIGASGYRAAINKLTAEGLVDPKKVGIIAWSHMGPYALQGLIDDPTAYKAATLAEASSNGYWQYLAAVDYQEPFFRAYMHSQIGAWPVGSGLKVWLKRSPLFQVDRVCTPILFQTNGPDGLVYGWGDYSAFRAQEKPVDLLYIRNGTHALVKPQERFASQEMNVDWYDYWLNGHKDPNPSKVDQYRRWDAMKTNMPKCAPPLPGIH